MESFLQIERGLVMANGEVVGRTEVSCSVCCLHFGRDCDLLEVKQKDGARVWTCESNLPVYEDDCGFEVPAGTPIEEIRRLQMQRIEVLRAAVSVPAQT